MQQLTKTRSMRFAARARTIIFATIATTIATTIAATAAQAQETDPRTVLKAMADYLVGQKTITATFDTDIEVITTTLQKIQFTSSGQLQFTRPNQIRVNRSGGYADVELIFDGNVATIVGKHNNTYTQIKAQGTLDDLVTKLRDENGMTIPGMDLLLTKVFDEIVGDASEISMIGHGVVDGKDCYHIAFRGPETDWQIWIEIGANPIPRKYVITSKTVAGAPQYTLRINSWSTDAKIAADAFTFKAAAGAKQVDIKELADLDEVPAGIVTGALK